jgi:predicted aldo/keto reductase-like oxidoreductase
MMMNNSKKINRRNFLATGLTSAVVVAAGSATASPQQKKMVSPRDKTVKDLPYNPRTHKIMPTRNLGKTGYQVGLFSLGGQATVEIKGKEKESIDIVNKAIDLGVNYVDTAASYGGGVSETHIGKVIKNRRHEVFLASKTHDRSYDGSMLLLEKSLKQLQTDHLDTWQLHNVKRKDELDKIFAKDGALKALIKAREEGMVHFLGITGHYEPLILEEGLNRFDFDTILMAVNAADAHYLSFKKYLLPIAQEKGIGIIGMKIATRGRMLSCWTPPPETEQPERMRTKKSGTVTMKEALYYNFTLPVSTNIVGCDNVNQVEENVKLAAEFSPLNEQQMAELEYKTLPIVRQGLYFRRWDLGA